MEDNSSAEKSAIGIESAALGGDRPRIAGEVVEEWRKLGRDRVRVTSELVDRSRSLFRESRRLCAESRVRLVEDVYARRVRAIERSLEPLSPVRPGLDVERQCPRERPRRAVSERLAPYVKYLSATSADEAFHRSYRKIIERAEEDGDWQGRARHLTPAQRAARSMVRRWEKALATVKAWRQQEPWATEARVIEDCTAFIEFVERAESDVRPRVLH